MQLVTRHSSLAKQLVTRTISYLLFPISYLLSASLCEASNGSLAGAGTLVSPYEIADYADLLAFADKVNNGDGTNAWAVLAADIDASASTNAATPWTPIGNSSQRYAGTFDGGNHVITGLTYNNENARYVGLFGAIRYGVVRNVGLEGGNITGETYVGGVVGNVYYGFISNCWNKSDVRGSTDVGGVAGSVYGGRDDASLQCTVTCCYNTGDVSADSYVGGVVGRIVNKFCHLTHSYNLGDVKEGRIYVGGVLGWNNNASFLNCFSAGVVHGSSFTVGGVAGNAGATKRMDSYYDKSVGGGIGATMGADNTFYNLIGLTTAQMTGAAALGAGNMEAFDQNVWATVAGGYPRLRPYGGPSLNELSRDVDGAYLISSRADWITLSTILAAGIDTSGKTFRQTRDISTVTLMAGASGTPFKGTYDGNGKTLSVNLEGTGDFVAPFSRITGATIRDLTVCGKVNGGMHCAGLVGSASGSNLVEGCVVKAEIATSQTHCGGILGHGGASSTTLSGCVFFGDIDDGKNAGTLWGWGDAGATPRIVDCLDASATTYPIGRGYACPGETDLVDTCYANLEKQTGPLNKGWWDQTGVHVFSVTGGEGVALTLQDGSPGIAAGGAIYAMAGENVKFDLAYSGTQVGGAFTTSAGVLVGDANPRTFLIPDRNVTISYVTPLRYWDPAGETNATCAAYTPYDGRTTLDAGWWVVSGAVTCGDRIKVSGDVNLVLVDGCALTADKGIQVAVEGGVTNRLVIWAQSDVTAMNGNAGKLTASGEIATAGIGGGGDANPNAGAITINGGKITAIGGEHGAGIGGGKGGAGGTIAINGGTVAAIAGVKAQAIGHGRYDDDSGTLSLPGMRVGSLGDNGEVRDWAAAGERDAYCRSTDGMVRVEVCLPHKYEGASCKWCGGSNPLANVAAEQTAAGEVKVRISFTLSRDVAGDAPDWNPPYLSILATDNATGSNYVADVSALSARAPYQLADALAGFNGTHEVEWDMRGLFPDGFCSTGMTFSVAYLNMPRYCVVDLSEGTGNGEQGTGNRYPVSYLDALPGGGWTDAHKTTNLVMRLVGPGTFMMSRRSSPAGGETFTLTNETTLTKPYYIGVFETTQRQWELVMGDRPSYFTNDLYYATRPVEKVSYDMIRGEKEGAKWPATNLVDEASFMGVLRQRTGIAAFDLPTEAQWAYACLAGTTSLFNNGGDEYDDMKLLGRYSNNGGSAGRDNQNCATDAGTAAVGSYLPNNWGLYDMHGNVCEWCLDWYRNNVPPEGMDPVGPEEPASNTSSWRELRNGGWNHAATYCTSYTRSYAFSPTMQSYYGGFRLVRTLSNDFESERSAEAAAGTERAGTVCAGVSEPVAVGMRDFADTDIKLTPYDAPYDGLAHTIGIATNAIEGLMLKYAVGRDASTTRPDGRFVETSLPEYVNVTNVTVWVEASAPGYYTFITNATVTIAQRAVTFSGQSETNAYTGAEIVITNLAVGNLVAGQTHNVSFSAKGTEVGGLYAGTITDTGDVVIRDGDGRDVTANYAVTVENGALTIVQDPALALEVSLADGAYTYDGRPHALPGPATNNAASGVTTVEYSKDQSSWTADLSALTATDVADSCTIHVRASNPNYANTATTTAALTITRAGVGGGTDEPGGGEVPVGGVSKFDTSFAYDGKGHTIDTNALVAAFSAAMGEGTGFAYAPDDGGAPAATWTAEAPTFVNAGEYIAWYKVTNPNYNDFVHAAKVTITKAANAWITAPSMAGWTAGATPASPNKGKAKFGTATVAYGKAGGAAGGLGAARPSAAGNYVATFTVAGTANYGGLVRNVPFTVKPKPAPKTYAVKFSANGGTLAKGKSMAAQSFTPGKAKKLRGNAFTRKGYVFIGWAKRENGPVAYKNAQAVKNLGKAGKTVTLYAVWANAQYKVVFDASGGRGKMAAQTFKYGEAQKLYSNKFTRKGYVFGGWAIRDPLATVGKVAYKDGQKVKNLSRNGGTVKLYAVWKKR